MTMDEHAALVAQIARTLYEANADRSDPTWDELGDAESDPYGGMAEALLGKFTVQPK